MSEDFTGPKPKRLPSISTSSSGSNQNMPLDPLRIISPSTPRSFSSLAIVKATESEPSAKAVVSCGIKNVMLISSLQHE